MCGRGSLTHDLRALYIPGQARLTHGARFAWGKVCPKAEGRRVLFSTVSKTPSSIHMCSFIASHATNAHMPHFQQS